MPATTPRRNPMTGPKPKFNAAVDAPVEGEACVFHIVMTSNGTTQAVAASALLGPGRDYLTMDDARLALLNVDNDTVKIASTLHGPYATISDLLSSFPDAKLEGTAKRLLAVEWLRGVEAAGLEPCDRCGGEGGWKGWPGYTCFSCGGHGTQEVAAG
jgi:hypothetical protein